MAVRRLPVLLSCGLVSCVLGLGVATGREASPGDFSAARAEAHVRQLAETIGSRPLGSETNRRARAYLARALVQAGFTVEVHHTVARRPELGLSASVNNLVALREGPIREAIALVAHYDSVPFGPGAGDDAFGAAVAVEAGRALAARGLRHSLVVLLTDGEEAGLMGAAGLVEHPLVKDRVRAYLNFDAIGAAGPVLLFETGPGNHWLVELWRRAVPRPRGASYALEIYRRLPNDTDFSIFRQAGLPGLNFALVGDGYAYHTDRDRADRLDRRALAEAGGNVVALVQGLDRANLSLRSDDGGVYFDLFGRWSVSYDETVAGALNVLAALGALAAWARASRTLVRLGGWWPVIRTALWAVVAAAAAGGAMVAAVAVWRVGRDVLHPWYAHPLRLAALLGASGGTAAWLVVRVVDWRRWQGAAHPAAVWVVALPLWLIVAMAAEARAPLAAFLWTLPLAAAAIAFAPIRFHRPVAVRAASLVVLLVVLVLWGRDAVLLVEFLVAVFGREPGVTPVWTYPALLLVVGSMLVPPVVALGIAPRRPRGVKTAVTAAWLLLLATAAGLAASAEAYTPERPLRRSVRYVQQAGQAVWEIGGHERAFGLPGPREALVWRPAVGPPFDGGWVAPLRHAFVWRARTLAAAALPADLTGSARGGDEGISLTLQVMPRTVPLAVTVLLPTGLVPRETSWPGRIDSRGAWRATFVGVDAAGVEWHAAFAAGAAARLAAARVLLETAALPGAPAGALLPPWLAHPRVTWTSRATYVVALGAVLGERP